MRLRYFFVRYTDDGLACLEDKEGRSIRVPAEWLPEAAAPGATVRVRALKGFDSTSLSISVKDAFTKTQVPPDTLSTSPKEN